MQVTRVRALFREDPKCHGATKSVRHNYWACALEPASHNYWARAPQLLKPARLEPVLRNKRRHRNEKPAHRNEDPMQPKINKINKLKKKKEWGGSEWGMMWLCFELKCFEFYNLYQDHVEGFGTLELLYFFFL